MTRITKSVITAAGRGKRLLPYTKAAPKEMLPVYVKNGRNDSVLKPLLQIIFESVFDFGIRDFSFVVGSSKRSVVDYFLSDFDNEKTTVDFTIKQFFSMVKSSNIVFAQQPFPLGFGDAVLRAKPVVEDNNFLLQAGDNVILSKKNNHLQRLEEAFFKYDADMAFLVAKVDDPRPYGVVEGKQKDDIIEVENMEEKPKKPKSNLAVIGTYIFKPTIFDFLEKVEPDKNNEIQLSDAMKKMIENKKSVAVQLNDDEKRIDFGSAESYIECLNLSYEFYNKN